ncbi:MAG TPA: aminotransferase class IV [Solirubrobacteraceae bacterium]|nr:aminotransferase class IV [Solirubrobacteraceae bacterium]
MPPADHDTVLRWTEEGLRPLGSEPPPGALLAADSFLVSDGTVRGDDAHWERFGGWCDELGFGRDIVAGFRADVAAALPRTGRWFPRVEAVAPVTVERRGSPTAPRPRDRNADAYGCRLRLRLRPARPALREARVLLGPAGDPRTSPRVKGPDLELLLALRSEAVAAGMDEQLLRDDHGRLVEGALDSLLWWEGDVLWTTPPEVTLPGVTRRLLLEIARERGVRVDCRSPQPFELGGREAWLTNALHGIRVITSWGTDAVAAPAGAPARADAWRSALDRTARHLDGR